MSFAPRPIPPEVELRNIDSRLTQLGPEIKRHRNTVRGNGLQRELDSLLDRRFVLRPVVHRCTSEENWAALRVLEEEAK